MFNKKNRKEAVEELEKSISKYNRTTEKIKEKSERLYKDRLILKENLGKVEQYVNSISNKPKMLTTKVEELKLALENYQVMLDTLQKEIKKSELGSSRSAIAGAAAGIGIAAFGPSVAMGIATTFGTASTGTAISSLAGAAASKAALAWLGGGALAAGGKGIAGGSVLLGLAGPVGWAIGGSAIIGGGLFANANNKKQIAEASKKTLEVNTQSKVYEGFIMEINELNNLVKHSIVGVGQRLLNIKNYPENYMEMNEDQKYELGTLINLALSGNEQLNIPIGK